MTTPFTESTVEEAALAWPAGLGYAVLPGPSIAPGGPQAERSGYSQVVLHDRLRQALARLNPELPAAALDDAFRKLVRADGPTLTARNHSVHRMLVDGVKVEYQRPDGSVAGAQARVLDYRDPDNNDWLAVNQLTVSDVGAKNLSPSTRRPDIVLFVNGLPLAVIELKNPADKDATIWTAFQQLQTYKQDIPSLFAYNEALVVSDGVQARVGTLTANREWFLPWRTVTGAGLAPPEQLELEVLLQGAFEKDRFLDLLRHFIVFEDAGAGTLAKKMAGYHQYHAVNVAVEETLRASRLAGLHDVGSQTGRYEAGARPGGEPGDRRVGVVWHTQGAGKSLTMAFYAGRLVLHHEMQNPSIVVITDRNDLDDQLFGTFARCQELLRQPPVQAESRDDLREKLHRDAGGVVFTTVQKFLPDVGAKDFSPRPPSPLPSPGDVRAYNHTPQPPLSDRRNIVVIADEAHRSQYDFIDGFARHMRDALPNASFIGFTGTPIELADKNTRAVFGDYISVYDIERAVQDGATVPIYYEGRLARLALDEKERPRIDPQFEEATEGEEVARKEKLKSKWAQLEAVVGAEKRVRLVAQDLVAHFERRLDAMEGKAMVVCMSRRICVELYRAIVALRPAWAGQDDAQGIIKVVMTGSAPDPLDWQPHIRDKSRREALAGRFRNPSDPFKIVIVRDMWLTGFDAPSLHTMYVDKPMRGHGLMQAIARVNRVFRDKPGGLVVDYLGLADELRQALATYTESGGTGRPAIDQAQAVALMLEKYEVCRALFHGFDWSHWVTGTPQQRLAVLPLAQEHILAQPDGKDRLLQAVSELSRAFALAVPHDRALQIRDDVAFFQAVRAVLAKAAPGEHRPDEDLDHAIRQIISILSDGFLAEVRGMPHRNLAVELLRRLLNGEMRTRARKNVVQARSFSQMLEQAIRRYQNRAIETAQVIEELIALAKDMRPASWVASDSVGADRSPS